jgi:hypothetical protein
MWTNNFYQQPDRRGNPWQQANRVIHGNKGPLGAPRPHEGYDNNPQYKPGARGFNAAYNQLNQENTPDWFGRHHHNTVQYTSSRQPSYWDAFGYGAAQVQYYGNGKPQLDLQDVQEAFKANQVQAQSVLHALDTDGSCHLSEQELATFALLSDSPGAILWNVVKANKTNPNYPNPTGLNQLEAELRQTLMFDSVGNPIHRPADGRIHPADRALLNRAMTIAPDVVKTTLQELKQTLNLDQAYSSYTQANQRWQQTFHAPPAGGYNPGNYNHYGNQSSRPANASAWPLLNWLYQQPQVGNASNTPVQLQVQLYLLMLMLSTQSSSAGNGYVNTNPYVGNTYASLGLPAYAPGSYTGAGDSSWMNQPLQYGASLAGNYPTNMPLYFN